MKARLITNGVLSIVSFGIYFLLFTKFEVYLWVIFSFLWLAHFVMGIITLSMEKHQEVRGLTIASGVLGIFGGVLFVNAIVSFIAVAKINKTEKYHNDILNDEIRR